MTTWVKVYNSMPQNPKFLIAGERAAWLFVCGLCYCNEHLTDGFVPAHALPVVAPGVNRAAKLAGALVAAGLWHPVDGGWKVHDYGDYQRSAEKVRGERATDAARKAAGRPNGSPANVRADSTPDSERSLASKSRVEQSRVEESSLRSDSATAAPQRSPEDTDLEGRITFLCHLMSTEVRTAHGVAASSREALVIKAWRDACRAILTLDGFTAEQVEFAIRWVCRHHYWRNRIKSMTRLRSEMEQVAKEIRTAHERGQVIPIHRQPKESASDLLRALKGEAS